MDASYKQLSRREEPINGVTHKWDQTLRFPLKY